MRLVLLVLVALPALAQEQAVQRALIERDQQSAQFAARLRGAPLVERQRLENAFARQLLAVEKDLPEALRPYERQQAALAHFADSTPAAGPSSGAASVVRPLPAAMPDAVDVIPVQGP